MKEGIYMTEKHHHHHDHDHGKLPDDIVYRGPYCVYCRVVLPKKVCNKM